MTLPAWAAVVLGVGVAAGVSLRCEDGRVLLSEDGGPFQEIQLGDNDDAAMLRALLAHAGSEVTVPPVVVADGGQSPAWPKPDSAQPQNKGKSAPAKNGKSSPPQGGKPTPQPTSG